MATTTAAIVESAFDAVAAAITDAILTLSVTRTVVTGYDAANDAQTTTTTVTAGRAVFDELGPQANVASGAEVFPDYTIQPGDVVFYADVEVKVGDALTFTRSSGATQRVGRVYAARDLIGTGALYAGIVR